MEKFFTTSTSVPFLSKSQSESTTTTPGGFFASLAKNCNVSYHATSAQTRKPISANFSDEGLCVQGCPLGSSESSPSVSSLGSTAAETSAPSSPINIQELRLYAV
jgi:hypothetical protein